MCPPPTMRAVVSMVSFVGVQVSWTVYNRRKLEVVWATSWGTPLWEWNQQYSDSAAIYALTRLLIHLDRSSLESQQDHRIRKGHKVYVCASSSVSKSLGSMTEHKIPRIRRKAGRAVTDDVDAVAYEHRPCRKSSSGSPTTLLHTWDACSLDI